MTQTFQIIDQFHHHFGHKPSYIIRAPGRVNLLGGHVDYNQGWVLPVALNLSAYVAVSPNSSDIVSIHALDLNQIGSFTIQDLNQQGRVLARSLPTWLQYPASVAWALMQHGLQLNGMNALLTSTIPIGAGLSSSAAIEVAFGLAWESIGDWHVDRMSLAQLCQKAENDFIGMKSGLMDQFACLHGVAGCILFFDCRTLDWEAIPLPDGISIVVADTNVRRSLPDSAYNERRAACEQAVQILKVEIPHIQTLRDVSIAELTEYAHLLPETILRRAEHIVYECERTLSAVELLRIGDLNGFGAKMIDGHFSLRDLYEVSSPELDALIELATDLPGWHGSRLTGAGFGGCTVHLVNQNHAVDFCVKLSASYHEHTGKQASTWILQAADGAKITNLVQSQNNRLV